MFRLFNYSSFLILIVIFVFPLKAISKQNEIIQNQNTILTNCNIKQIYLRLIQKPIEKN